MKKLMKCVLEWKTGVCLAFTACMLIYVVIAALTGDTQIEIKAVCAMLLLTMTGTFVQYLCFTDNIIRNMRYTRRLMLFGVLFLPLLTLIAVLFGWFPSGKPGAWLLFLGLALAAAGTTRRILRMFNDFMLVEYAELIAAIPFAILTVVFLVKLQEGIDNKYYLEK